mgnify:CR=1 FL=1
MEPIPIRIHEDTKEALEYEAADQNISVSAYTRELLDKGREFDAQEHEDVLKTYTVSDESGEGVSQLRAITLRVEPSSKETLEAETADSDSSLSEHIRTLIAKGRAQEEIVAEESEPEQIEVPEEDDTEEDDTEEDDDLWAESDHQNDHSKMGEVSIELTVSSDINTWLEEQTADRELSTAAYIEELLAAARESGAESVISDDKVAQEAVDDGYADRFGTIEAEIEALNERQTDTVEGLSKLKQRLATLEAKIE